MKYKLPKEQSYIEEIAAAKGIETKLMHFDEESSSCDHKAKLLTEKTGVPWVKDDCVKAVYMQHDSHVVVFVSPDYGGHIPHEDMLKKAFPSMSKKDVGKYTMKKEFPKQCMEEGTCTPFPPEFMMERYVRHILVRKCPSRKGKKADVSIGGQGSLAHMTSMYLDDYDAIFPILDKKFHGQIKEIYIPEPKIIQQPQLL